jgi:hypothetical protein
VHLGTYLPTQSYAPRLPINAHQGAWLPCAMHVMDSSHCLRNSRATRNAPILLVKRSSIIIRSCTDTAAMVRLHHRSWSKKAALPVTVGLWRSAGRSLTARTHDIYFYPSLLLERSREDGASFMQEHAVMATTTTSRADGDYDAASRGVDIGANHADVAFYTIL